MVTADFMEVINRSKSNQFLEMIAYCIYKCVSTISLAYHLYEMKTLFLTRAPISIGRVILIKDLFEMLTITIQSLRIDS